MGLKINKNGSYKDIGELYINNNGSYQYLDELYKSDGNGGYTKIFDAGWPTTVSGPTSFTLPDARAHSTDWEIDGNVSQSGTPSAASPIEVEGVGNKYVYPNQEFNIARKSTASSIWGCTMTPNLTDGSIHLTGTGTINDYANGSGLSEWYPHGSMIAGHVYYLDMKGINNTGTPISYRPDGSSRIPWTSPTIFTRGSAGNNIFSWNVVNGQTYDTTFIPQVIDLTKSYGAGNEPLTIQEFKERLYADSLKLTAKDTYGQRFPTATSGSSAIYGVTVSALGNGKYRVTGTGTTTDWGRNSGFAQWATADMCTNEHKYYAYAKGAPSGLLRLRDFNGGLVSITSPVIITCTNYQSDYSICTYINKDQVYDATVEVFLIDLTELYGAGNEPSTVDEFLQRKGINGDIPVLPYRADASYKYAIPIETADHITHIRLDAPLYKIGTGTDSLTADGTRTTSIGHTVLSAGTSTISDAATNAPYYCSQQTNGTLSGTSITLDTGVTDADVYYVKATPTTSTVDVIDISTIKGNNTVDITTDVAPSNATITYRKRTK